MSGGGATFLVLYFLGSRCVTSSDFRLSKFPRGVGDDGNGNGGGGSGKWTDGGNKDPGTSR